MYNELRRFAGAFLIDIHNNLIMQKRDENPIIDNPGTISVFGGTVEENETYEEGLIREINEELEIDIRKMKVEFLADTFKIENNIRTNCKFFIIRNIIFNTLNVNEGKAILLTVEQALNEPFVTATCKKMLEQLKRRKL